MASEWKPDICIYHGGCMDGFGAAWAVAQRFGDSTTYLPATYGDAPPDDIAGKNVLIVDFSYKRPVLEQMSAEARSVIILDHHKSAEQDLAGLNHICGGSIEVAERILARSHGPLSNVLADFDMEHSGAVMAWRFCHPGTRVPGLLRYVEDRDLWRFDLASSREVSAVIASTELHFVDWDRLASEFGVFGKDGAPEAQFIEIGKGILRQREKDIDAMLCAALRWMVIGGHRVPVANVPFMWASDAGNILGEGNPFAATYFDAVDGRRFSLRSHPDGLDVSEIAQRYGGGGHKHAAGFTMPIGWEGDPDA